MTRLQPKPLWALALPLFLGAAARATEPVHEGGGDVNLFAGDVGNAVWTVTIFLLVVFVLGKYAWGPLLAALQR
ncbi:MAG: hypothetical protein ACRD0X_06330, partial [Thermoanaerobaculia bacterium]